MIYFSIADGVIVLVIFSILTLIILNIIRHRKEGVCSSCTVYKSSKRKANGIQEFYKKVKD
jgi:competence protein ComGC